MRQVARRLQSLNNRVFRRITRDEVREGLSRLGLAPGDTVCANVSMRSLGYVREGPAASWYGSKLSFLDSGQEIQRTSGQARRTWSTA